MPPDDAVRIRHMIDAAEAAKGFVLGRRRCDLETDLMLRFALVRAVEIIGEAASKIRPESRALAPALPWPALIAMRNRLVHAYFEIDHDILWKTATTEIPDLLSLLRAIPLEE